MTAINRGPHPLVIVAVPPDAKALIVCPACQVINFHTLSKSGDPVYHCPECDINGVPPIYPDRTLQLIECGHTFYLPESGDKLFGPI